MSNILIKYSSIVKFEFVQDFSGNLCVTYTCCTFVVKNEND
jgi:hypothetical protein